MSNRRLYLLVHGTLPPRRAPRRQNPRKPARSWKYRNWIGSLPCAACGSERDIQAAHTQHNGMASKGSDYSAVPLCVPCHHEYDNGLRSKELFEQDNGISMAEVRRGLNRAWFKYSNEVK